MKNVEARKAVNQGAQVGREVRCVLGTASKFWQNADCTVLAHNLQTGHLQLRLESTGTTTWVDGASAVAEMPAGFKPKPALPEKLDMRRLTLAEKLLIWKLAGQNLQFVQPKTLLEGPELSVGWMEIQARGEQAKDLFSSRQTIFVEPHGIKAVAYALENGTEQPETMLKEVTEQLAWLKVHPQQAGLVMVLVHSEAPQHWTALVCMRQADSLFGFRYFDSLHTPHAEARQVAEQIASVLVSVLGEAAFSQPALQATEQPVAQTDGWSCGYHTLSRFEEAYRQLRGEGCLRVYASPDERRQAINKLASAVMAACKKAGACPAPLPAPESAEVKPAQLPDSSLPPKPALAGIPTGTYGCSRCRQSAAGCLSCNPEKMLKHASK